VNEALKECNALSRLPALALPCVTFLGTDEKIVDKEAILSRMDTWETGTLEWVEAGEHEVLMEGANKRAPLMAHITALFDAQR
jgi:lysophospholipase